MSTGNHADHHAMAAPSPWIVRHAHLVAPGARVLDLACGEGRHARYFAARGAAVLAVDRNADALAGLAGTPGITTLQCDLEGAPWPFPGERFDAIVVVNYLHRPLFPQLFAALAPAGVWLYETLARGNEAFGRPSNPDFLLAPDELLQRLPPELQVVGFEQGVVTELARQAVLQRIAAVGRARAWPPRLPRSKADE